MNDAQPSTNAVAVNNSRAVSSRPAIPPAAMIASTIASSQTTSAASSTAATTAAAWPAPLQFDSTQMAAMMREAGYEEAAFQMLREAQGASFNSFITSQHIDPSSRATAAAAASTSTPAASSSFALSPSTSPVPLFGRIPSSSTFRFQPDRIQIDSQSRSSAFNSVEPTAAAATAAAAADSSATSPASAMPFTSTPIPAPTTAQAFAPLIGLDYDLFLGHVIHLFRASLQLEKRLLASAAASIKQEALRKYELTFIDPFGTSLQISVRPFQLLSDLIQQQLQSYVPAHLKTWCKFAISQPPPPSCSPAGRPSASPTSGRAGSALKIPGFNYVDERIERLTLAEAGLIAYENTLRPKDYPHSLEAGVRLLPLQSPSKSSSNNAWSSSSSSPNVLPTLTVYGELKVVLRNSLISSASPLSSSYHDPSNSSSSSTPGFETQSHVFTMQVRGLDSLAAIRQRIYAHALQIYCFDILQSDMYSCTHPFSLPLELLTQQEGNGILLNSMDQTLFASGLCEQRTAEQTLSTSPPPNATSSSSSSSSTSAANVNSSHARVLLVDVREFYPSTNKFSSKPLTVSIRSLNGKLMPLKVDSTRVTIGELKYMISQTDLYHNFLVSQQKLVFKHTTLDDDNRDMESYGIRHQDTITLLLKLKEIQNHMRNTKQQQAKKKGESDQPSFRLQVGKLGVNPLCSDAQPCAQLLMILMAWTLPPSSKLRTMEASLLESLLVHTRQLLNDTHECIQEQSIYGHSSKGKAWMDEKKIKDELAAIEAGKDKSKQFGRASSSPSSMVEIVDLDEDEDDEVRLGTGSKPDSGDKKTAAAVRMKRSVSASSASPSPSPNSFSDVIDLSDDPGMIDATMTPVQRRGVADDAADDNHDDIGISLERPAQRRRLAELHRIPSPAIASAATSSSSSRPASNPLPLTFF